MKTIIALCLLAFAGVANALNPLPTVTVDVTSATFTWTATDADSYKIMQQYKTAGGVTTFKQVALVTGTSYTATNLTASTAYLYRVLSYYSEYDYWSYSGAKDLKFTTLAVPVAASIYPVSATMVSFRAGKVPCYSSFRVTASPYSVVYYGPCEQGLLQDDPAYVSAHVTMQLRKDTIIEVVFAQPIRTFIANLCMGCEDEYNSISTVSISTDFGVTWKKVGNYGPIIQGPLPNAVVLSSSGIGMERQSRDASLQLTVPASVIWVRGFQTVLTVPVREYLPNIFHVRGVP